MKKMTSLPCIWLSLTPVVLLVAMLTFCVMSFGTATLSGASQLALLVASAVSVSIGIGVYRLKWDEIERTVVSTIGEVMPSVILLLMIGALSGAWMVSGIVPGFIYYGMQVIHPKFFLATACIVCILVSMMTGSSWTTIATLGIAFIGIGKAQGFDAGMVAGAIISGAYFGDKMSPLSDTTVLASSVTKTPIFTHIRYMTVTTVPAMLLALAVFAILGFNHEVTAAGQMELIMSGLSGKFNITPWIFAVPAMTIVLVAMKLPSIASLFISAMTAAVFALVTQGDVLREIAPGGDSAVKGVLAAVYGKVAPGFSDKILSDLTSSNGMAGMLNTIWLIICAMVFGGTMKASRMLDSIAMFFRRLIFGRTSMVASTVFSGIFFNSILADQYLAIILTGSVYMPVYTESGYEPRLLSRTTEDAVTVTSPLLPWSTCGMTQATMLGVPTVVYMPYCFFNILCPVFTLAVAAAGFGIRRVVARR